MPQLGLIARACATLVMVLGTTTGRTEPIPTGLHQQTAVVQGISMVLLTYRPVGCSVSSLLLAFHGSERNAQGARANARHFADRHCMLLLAPLFEQRRFPLSRYNQIGMVDKGRLQASGTWSAHISLGLVAWARIRIGASLPYALIGHSAGAQHLARIAAFVPNEARRIVLANPGAHVFPSLDFDVPYGFGKLFTAANADVALQSYLAQPIILLLGEKDIDEDDPATGPGAKAQGKSRLERGINAFHVAKSLAENRGWPFNWRLIRVPGVGHNGRAMYASPEAAGIFE